MTEKTVAHFNPDDDRDPLPEPVAEMRALLRCADAVLFSTPEYAGSLPGSFKNLLDWTVGGSCIYRLPIGWINPSAHGGSQDTYAALRIVLDRADADVIEAACKNMPVRGTPSMKRASSACRRYGPVSAV